MTTAETQILERLVRLEQMVSQLLIPQDRQTARQMAILTPAEIRASNKAVIKSAKEKIK